MADYRFIDKDPVIDVIRTEAAKGGNFSDSHLERISYDSGVSVGTLRNWFNGDTRRPLSITTQFVLAALGVKIIYQREEDGTSIRQAKPTLISAADQRKLIAKDKERDRLRAEKKAKE